MFWHVLGVGVLGHVCMCMHHACVHILACRRMHMGYARIPHACAQMLDFFFSHV